MECQEARLLKCFAIWLSLFLRVQLYLRRERTRARLLMIPINLELLGFPISQSADATRRGVGDGEMDERVREPAICADDFLLPRELDSRAFIALYI